MNEVLTEFLEFFGLDGIYSVTNAQELLTTIVVSFIALIFVIVGLRMIFELVKIVTDWSRFK